MIDDKIGIIDGSRLIINKLPVKFEKLQLFIDLDKKLKKILEHRVNWILGVK